jgi:hypothetical protein
MGFPIFTKFSTEQRVPIRYNVAWDVTQFLFVTNPEAYILKNKLFISILCLANSILLVMDGSSPLQKKQEQKNRRSGYPKGIGNGSDEIKSNITRILSKFGIKKIYVDFDSEGEGEWKMLNWKSDLPLLIAFNDHDGFFGIHNYPNYKYYISTFHRWVDEQKTIKEYPDNNAILIPITIEESVNLQPCFYLDKKTGIKDFFSEIYNEDCSVLLKRITIIFYTMTFGNDYNLPLIHVQDKKWNSSVKFITALAKQYCKLIESQNNSLQTNLDFDIIHALQWVYPRLGQLQKVESNFREANGSDEFNYWLRILWNIIYIIDKTIDFSKQLIITMPYHHDCNKYQEIIFYSMSFSCPRVSPDNNFKNPLILYKNFAPNLIKISVK